MWFGKPTIVPGYRQLWIPFDTNGKDYNFGKKVRHCKYRCLPFLADELTNLKADDDGRFLIDLGEAYECREITAYFSLKSRRDAAQLLKNHAHNILPHKHYCGMVGSREDLQAIVFYPENPNFAPLMKEHIKNTFSSEEFYGGYEESRGCYHILGLIVESHYQLSELKTPITKPENIRLAFSRIEDYL
jgi:hypothetical protein